MTMRQLFRLSLSALAFAGPLLCAGQPASDKELFQAVAKGDMGAVRVQLDNGASIEAKDERGDTPVIVAVGNHNIAMVKLLLEKGADISARNNYEETALIEAARSMDPDMLRILLSGNPDIKEKMRRYLRLPRAHQ
jgi:ankyrin repeat protein